MSPVHIQTHPFDNAALCRRSLCWHSFSIVHRTTKYLRKDMGDVSGLLSVGIMLRSVELAITDTWRNIWRWDWGGQLWESVLRDDEMSVERERGQLLHSSVLSRKQSEEIAGECRLCSKIKHITDYIIQIPMWILNNIYTWFSNVIHYLHKLHCMFRLSLRHLACLFSKFYFGWYR